MIFHLLCVAKRYDTHQEVPLAIVSEIHCKALTDVSFSSDGRFLLVHVSRQPLRESALMSIRVAMCFFSVLLGGRLRVSGAL